MSEQTIVITGASSGIGYALALNLSYHNNKLVLAARNEKSLNELKIEVEKNSSIALVVPTDISSQHACKNLIEKTITEFGEIDILVNNAGISMKEPLSELTDMSIFEHMMSVNYFGYVWCTKYALPHLKKTNGRIIVVSSLAGLVGVPTRSAYASSKHAVNGFFDSLRLELIMEKSGISITMVTPTAVNTNVRGGNDEKIKGIMSADECADIIVKAMKSRKRLVFTTWKGRIFFWQKFFTPGLLDKLVIREINKIRRAT